MLPSDSQEWGFRLCEERAQRDRHHSSFLRESTSKPHLVLNAFDEAIHAKAFGPLKRAAPYVQLPTKSLEYGCIELVVGAGVEHRREGVL